MREFGSEYPTILKPDDYFLHLSDYGNCIYLRSGREAISFSAKNITRCSNLVLMPAYCCWSMSAPFVNDGWDIRYYRLNPDLTVDVHYLEEILSNCSPDAILVMNYYGISPTDEAVEFVKKNYPQCVVIEDFSHCPFSFSTIYNSQVDFYIASLRKTLGISDGSIVITRRDIDKTIINPAEDSWAQKRYDAQLGKLKYYYSQDKEIKESFRNELWEAEDLLNHFDSIYAISSMGIHMLEKINAEVISYARKENFMHLLSILKNTEGLTFPDNIENSINGVPFSLPVLTDCRDDLQKCLAQKGVYAPVLWPISDEAMIICPVSRKISEKMLSLPIDQRYSYDDMERIGELVKESIQEIYA